MSLEESIMKRSASAVWTGDLKNGKGTISTESGVLSAAPYSFKTRFEGDRGTNPEELIGAAHAGCFSMALSFELQKAGMTAERIDTKADVTIEQKDGGFVIPAVHLTLRAKIPGASPAAFESAANTAKANCPVSKLLKADITLDAQLEA
jgi:lipoyl-dependent peroxiredoxin